MSTELRIQHYEREIAALKKRVETLIQEEHASRMMHDAQMRELKAGLRRSLYLNDTFIRKLTELGYDGT